MSEIGKGTKGLNARNHARHTEQVSDFGKHGDVIHIEGLGIFAVQALGWRELTHRLTVNAVIRYANQARVTITFNTPRGETVTLARADVQRWVAERDRANNWTASDAALAALNATLAAEASA